MANPEPQIDQTHNLRTAMENLAAKRSLLLCAAARELATNKEASPDTLEHLENIEKLDEHLRAGSAKQRKKLELVVLSVVALILMALCLIRVKTTSMDIELYVTEARFALNKGTSMTLIPGETGQILNLKRATVSGIEATSPESRSSGGRIDLRAIGSTEKDLEAKIDKHYDPSIRLYSIVLPSDSAFTVRTSIAYSGNSRGLNLKAEGSSPIEASFGQVITANTQDKQPSQGIDQVAVDGKSLDFTLFPADESHELAVFRDVHVSDLSFQKDGRSTILKGTAYIRGESPTGQALRPSDLLVLSTQRPILLRELTLVNGGLKVVASIPYASSILLGEDSPQELKPTLFQWVMYRWPNQFYATLTALIAAWLAVRRWWESAE